MQTARVEQHVLLGFQSLLRPLTSLQPLRKSVGALYSGNATCLLSKQCTLKRSAGRTDRVDCKSSSLDSSHISAPIDPPKQQQSNFKLVLGAVNIPHPDKAHYGGEDAYFISNQGGGAFGVADGVGGWAESGINPAEYSSGLMTTSQQYLEGTLELPTEPTLPTNFGLSSSTDSTTSISSSSDNGDDNNTIAETMATIDNLADSLADTGTILSASYSETDSESNFDTARQKLIDEGDDKTPLGALRVSHKLTRKPGSSTALVAQFNATTGELTAANLGDSGFLLIRDGSVAYTTPIQQHFFDCPFQFGAAPEYTPATDTADDASIINIQLCPGDVVIAGTDGLLDNCWPDEIAKLAPCTSSEVQNSAQKLAELANEHGLDPNFVSPYAVEATEEGIDIPFWEKLASASFDATGSFKLGGLKGGKLDDVTVVVAYVEKVEGGGGGGVGTSSESVSFENTEF